MRTTKKARDIQVGDTYLIHWAAIGTLSLTSGKFKRGGESGVDEHEVIRIEEAHDTEAQFAGRRYVGEVKVPYVVLWYRENVGTKYERESASWFQPDDDVNVKES
jgi:hypothetical protein